jgi:glycosyltransferase involved in cell wall biosynthesis
MLAPGSWVHSRRPLNWILDSGHCVIFVDKDKPEIGESKRFIYFHYPQSRGKRFFSCLGEKITSYITDFTKMVGLKIIQLKHKPDITHVHWLNYRAYHAVLAKIHPLVVSVLGSDVNRFFEGNYSKAEKIKTQKVLKRADLVLVDSMDMIEKCRKLSNDQVKVIYFPIGIDTKKFSLNYNEKIIDWRNSLGIEPGAFIITSIRAMEKKYNHDLIIEAFANALPNVNSSVYLLLKDFNSQDNDYVHKIKKQISSMGLDSKIIWINKFIPDSEMPVLYALSDLIINFPSYDAFPVSFIEAAAAGKPVLTCDLPAYQNTFAEKYFNFVEKENIVALENEIVDFFNNKTKDDEFPYTEMVKFVSENYDEEISKNNLLKVYYYLSQYNSRVAFDHISKMNVFQ